MKEAQYQSAIASWVHTIGGHWVNGSYTKAGEADLQCAIPVPTIPVLVHIAIEVKTEDNYHRVMSAINEDYHIIDSAKLKSHETLQITKIRLLRDKGGLALVAYNYEQIQDYILEVLGEHI